MPSGRKRVLTLTEVTESDTLPYAIVGTFTGPNESQQVTVFPTDGDTAESIWDRLHAAVSDILAAAERARVAAEARKALIDALQTKVAHAGGKV